MQNHLDTDKSKIFKSALMEKYEELVDIQAIKAFEKREKEKKRSSHSGNDLIEEIKNKFNRGS